MNDLAILEAIPADDTEHTNLQAFNYDWIIESFLASLDLKPRTLEAYRKGLRYFFGWMKDHGISQPTRSDIKAYKADLLESYRVSTVASYLAAVRVFFKFLSNETGRPELNIADGIRAPKQTKSHKKDALSKEQAIHLLGTMPRDTLADKRNYAIVSLILGDALREIEVTRLNMNDLYTTDDASFINVWGKGRDTADETLKVPDYAFRAIQEYIQARTTRDGEPKDNAPLFASVSRRDYGQRLNPRTISSIGKNALKAAGYDSPRLTTHSLRHTAATVALQEGASLDEVQALLRHSSPATTMIYNHDGQRKASKAADILGNAFSA